LRFEVEDAGGGCCLGPEIVVVLAADGRSCVQSIDPRLGKRRQAEAERLVLRAFEHLGVDTGDEILICRGDLFDVTASALAERGFQIERGPVSGDAHQLAEETFLRRLRSILGYRPRFKDRRYAQLNMLLRAEAGRRPALRRFWKANVRRPAEWTPPA